jgi:hypothetical protein
MTVKDVQSRLSSILLIMALTVSAVVLTETEAAASTENVFRDLSAVCKKYNAEIRALATQYRNAANDTEKNNIKKKRDEVGKDYEANVEQLVQANSLIGKEIPFVQMSGLPFKVQNVNITKVSRSSVKFDINVTISEDIKDETGEISQRAKVYFMGFDSSGNKIPGSANYAVNHGWMKLTAGTAYPAQGHWNSDDIENFGDFSVIKVLTEEEYKHIK